MPAKMFPRVGDALAFRSKLTRTFLPHIMSMLRSGCSVAVFEEEAGYLLLRARHELDPVYDAVPHAASVPRRGISSRCIKGPFSVQHEVHSSGWRFKI